MNDADRPDLDGLDTEALKSHPDIPYLGPLAGSFTWDIRADQWCWSDEMYVIHGFAPGDVVPTTDLLLSHKHPEDRTRAEGVVERFLDTGQRFACYHRILDAQAQVRYVVVVAGGATDAEDTPTEMSGFMVDLTDTRREEFQPAVQAALSDALVHRSAIDMAKGAIMLGYGTTPDEAFDLLRAMSSRSNLKVRDLAHRLVAGLSEDAGEVTAAEQIHTLLAQIIEAPATVSSNNHSPTRLRNAP